MTVFVAGTIASVFLSSPAIGVNAILKESTSLVIEVSYNLIVNTTSSSQGEKLQDRSLAMWEASIP